MLGNLNSMKKLEFNVSIKLILLETDNAFQRISFCLVSFSEKPVKHFRRYHIEIFLDCPYEENHLEIKTIFYFTRN